MLRYMIQIWTLRVILMKAQQEKILLKEYINNHD